MSTTIKNRINDDVVVIVSALRTPLCRAHKGGLAKIPPSTLLQTVLQATLQQGQQAHGRLEGKDVEDVVVGNCLQSPPATAYAALRMACIAAGLPAETTSFMTLNRQCSSGLQACAVIANRIACQEICIGIGAGVESMSWNSMSSNVKQLPDVDWNVMQTHRSAMDCLIPMGITSETLAKKFGLQRHLLDDFAVASHQKAAAAHRAGKFQAEIVPVMGNIYADDGIRPKTTRAILSRLKPAFMPNGGGGVTTAGNASQMTDGAAAVLMMTRGEARRRGLPILGTWRGFATAAVPPSIMGIGPAVAIPKVLQQTGLSMQDIDVFEINEAFASQALCCVNELNIPMEKVNPNGGAIALGHPLGCTGARMIGTLLQELHRRRNDGARFGIVSMCVGTGMGAAAVLEVEPRSSL
jgi:acetyl-CoA acyltransferase 1